MYGYMCIFVCITGMPLCVLLVCSADMNCQFDIPTDFLLLTCMYDRICNYNCMYIMDMCCVV